MKQVVFRIKMWFGSPPGKCSAANNILHRNAVCQEFEQPVYIYAFVRKNKHDKKVHVVVDTMTSPKNRINSLLAYNQHLKLKDNVQKSRKVWYGSRTGEVQCRKRSFYDICGPEAIRVWLPKPDEIVCILKCTQDSTYELLSFSCNDKNVIIGDVCCFIN